MSDMLFGAFVLVLFLVVAVVAGYFFYKFKNARLANAWGPLVGLVNGKVVGDGGGGASSWLSGTYQGRPVVAKLAPDLNAGSANDSSGLKYNYFDVALTNVPGRQDWSIDYVRGALGLGKAEWRVVTKDPALEAALSAAQVINHVAPLGDPPGYFLMPTVNFSRHDQTLRYRADISPYVAPPPERFLKMVALLQQLAEINAQVNPAQV